MEMENIENIMEVDSDQLNMDSNISMHNKAKFMRLEENRKNSFINCNIPHIKKDECANVGLYYWKEFDLIQCAFCMIVLQNWTESDDPLKKHKKATKSCSYINAIELSHINLLLHHHDRKKKDEPQNYYMKEYEHRLASFEGWPESKTCGAITPENLSKFGFYFLKIHDMVCCFHCGAVLGGFKYNDDPLFEHIRWGKSCIFLKTLIDVDEMFEELRLAMAIERMNLEKEEDERIESTIVNVEKTFENPTEFICIICANIRQINLCLFPCGHSNICSDCYKTISPKCPTCRANILMPHRIYV